MKKNFSIIGSLMAATVLFFACTPENKVGADEDQKDNVTVSIAADAAFAEDLTATVTLTLSKAAASDVTVKLAKADPQSGKTAVTADFEKKVKIPAGQTTATVVAKADVLGLTDGEYQAAIKIDAVEGAKAGEPAVAYINFNYEFKPEVNVYADPSFSADCKAEVKVVLSKASSKDVTVTLATGEGTTAKVTVPETVVVKAGTTETAVDVTCDIAGIEAGNYVAVVEIASVDGAIVGGSKSVSITLQYPFSTAITVDGEFDDWASAVAFVTPEDAEFKVIRSLKLAATDKKMFVYFEIVEPNTEHIGDYAMPVDIFIDCDANVATGGKLTSTDNENTTLPFTDSGLNWYIELGNIHDGDGYVNFTWGAYKYIGADGGSIWSLENQTGNYGASECFGVGVLGEDGIGRVEIMFDRKFFMLVNPVASVGVKLMNGVNNWSCIGLAPMGSGSTRVDMAVINMPVYNEN